MQIRNLDVYRALAAIAWADGRLDVDEADAIVRAAVEAGIDLDDIAELEEATRTPIELGAIDRADLTKTDRVFIYAVASWIAALDGRVNPAEAKALARLGDELGVPERLRARAEAIAREVAALPEGDRPDRYDLVRLHALIESRLATAAASSPKS